MSAENNTFIASSHIEDLGFKGFFIEEIKGICEANCNCLICFGCHKTTRSAHFEQHVINLKNKPTQSCLV